MSGKKGQVMPKGVGRTKADKSLCLASGCNRKGLYRSPNKTANKRGYCAVHKHLAVLRTATMSTYTNIWIEWKGLPE